MPLEVESLWYFEDAELRGLSLSGIRTSIALPQLSLCFDVAQGFPFQFNIKRYFISHGHLDHAAGIPYLISQKAMNSLPPPVFYMPSSLIEPLQEIMSLWQKIEKHEYQYEFHSAEPGAVIEIDRQHFVRPFKTVHRIDSSGYTLFKKIKKLKPEYLNKSEAEIIQIKNQGHLIQDIHEIPWISFTGDTQIEFLSQADWIKKSKILIMEATYLDENKTREQARHWGHTHLDEVIERLDEIESERIVLIHTSSRYSFSMAQEILKKKIPQKHADRVVLFPGR